MPVFTKKDGTEIEVNDFPANTEAALAAGWKLNEAKEEPPEVEAQDTGIIGLIEAAETKDELKAVLEEAKITVDLRGSLAKVKIKALEAL